MSEVEDRIEEVHVVVQERNGALALAEVYCDAEAAFERYAELRSDSRHVKTLLKAYGEIEDL